MDREMIATQLLAIAQELVADWSPVRRDVNVSERNSVALQSLTTFAPGLAKEVRQRLSSSLAGDGYNVRPNDLVREWSKYFTFVDPENNNNKYHYYGVFSFVQNGQPLYVAVNASGRIGIVERAYDLTKKFQHGPASTLARAISAAETHMRDKIRKGYQPAIMTRG